MSNHVSAARSFMAAHARILDRRRFELLFDGADAEPVLAALRAYRNRDGGYDFQSHSPAAALEWRGYATVRALSVLRDNAIIDAPPRCCDVGR
jgi:hypothetical protein